MDEEGCGTYDLAESVAAFDRIAQESGPEPQTLSASLDGEAPSVAFWPALARWFHALEGRSGWVGSEERSALGL